ncbi:MAG: CCA tRNA nucleotidyltransferase [Clostridia bacterium]|nr:CCA tRNA nucleotidyltransferase [Clostridia bacterium]
MNIVVPEEIIELSEIFEKHGEKLYIVGGFVRDAIMEIYSAEKNDIDLASSCKPQKVVQILKNTRFQTDDSNAKYGAVVIYGDKRYEHTTFRRENYNLNGEHNPTGVEFVKDIREDALRRDFTINAIYYDIERKEIVDPVFGVQDIKNKKIVCPAGAEASFSEDAERILRMIRFMNSFGFLADERTLEAALKHSAGVSNLTNTRIRNEFDKMLVCDTFYPYNKESKYAHAKCLIMLGQFGLWKYILPAIDEIQESTILDNKQEPLYIHLINAVSVCEPEARLACLMHDVGKVYTKTHSNNFNFSKEWADIIIEQNLGSQGLGYPKSVVEKTKRIVAANDFDKHGWTSKKEIRKFIKNNLEDFEDICALKDAISLENTDYTKTSTIANRWRRVYHKMIKNNTPTTLKELNIDGNDIIEAVPEIKIEKVGAMLNNLLEYCLNHPKANTKELLKLRAIKVANKNREEYLEKE